MLFYFWGIWRGHPPPRLAMVYPSGGLPTPQHHHGRGVQTAAHPLTREAGRASAPTHSAAPLLDPAHLYRGGEDGSRTTGRAYSLHIIMVIHCTYPIL